MVNMISCESRLVCFVRMLVASALQFSALAALAQNVATQPPIVEVVPGVALPASDDAMERIEAVKTRAIVERFNADNPGAPRVALNVLTTGFEDDASNPALKITQMWTGERGFLLELFGLPRQGKIASAVMRRDTLRIRGKKGATSELVDAEGVTELRDRKGGAALVVNPGDTLYLRFERVDDYWPFTLYHVNRNGSESVYFDAVDPRFRERYDAMFAAATSSMTTPDAMKDFLFEFAANDPDKRATGVFVRLIKAMRDQNSFEGFYSAYLLIQDPEDGVKASKLARTDEHRMKLEHLAITGLVDKNRLFDIDLTVSPSRAESREVGNQGWLVGLFTGSLGKEMTRSAYRSIRGNLTIRIKATSPVKIRHGKYVAKFRVTAAAPNVTAAAGFLVGGGGASEVKSSLVVSVAFDGASAQATQSFDLGELQVAYYDRGTMNGYTRKRLTGDIVVEASLVGVEIAP